MPNSSAADISEVSPHLATSEILFEKLLVAIDFSEQSTRALKAAIALARCFGSELLLVHATSPAVYGTGMEPIPIEPYEVELQVAKARMEDLVMAEPALKELKHREFVEYASACDLIQQVARENHADLVVAGSQGASGLERLALGSVAESILNFVRCPVLIVGPHCHQELSPFRSILFATDLNTTGLRSAQFATSFAERFHGKLTLLHVIENKARHAGIQPELTEENIRQELAHLLPADLNSYTSATIRVEHGKPGDIISQVARSLCASIIVVGFGNRSSLADHAPWSTLSQVIREAPCPVLCVRRHFV